MGPNGYSYNRFAFDGEKEEHIREIIDITLQLVNQKIDENWIATLDVPLAAEIAMTKLLTVVNLAMYPHDGNIKLNLPLEHFQSDPEPRRCPVDSWARGAVPTRHIQAIEDQLFHLEGKSDGTRTPSVSSMRSSRTGGTKSSHSSRAISRGGTNRMDHIHDNSPKIIELDELNSLSDGSAGLNSTHHLYDLLQKQNNRIKKSTQVDEDTRDEFDLLQEQLSKTSAELKGKKYAVDATGKAIGIAPIKSDLLPPYSLYPSHNITSYDREKEKQEKPIGGKKGGRKRISGAEKDLGGPSSSSSSTSPSYPHFLPTPSLATSLSSYSNIPLAPGVSLKSKVMIDTSTTPHPPTTSTSSSTTQKPQPTSTSSPILREGPTLPSDPKKLSRTEYFAKQQIRMTSSGSLSNSLEKGDSMYSSHTGGLGEGFSEFSTTGVGVGGVGGGITTSSNSLSRGNLQSSSGGGVGHGVKTNRYLDINPLEGGKEINREKEQQEKEMKIKEELIKQYEMEKEKLNSNDRGGGGRGGGGGGRGGGGGGTSSTTATPHKPSTKQKEIIGQLHGSQYLAGPRDRLSSYALESRRKHVTYAADGTVEASNSLYAGGSTSVGSISATGGGSGSGAGGGSIKRERADLAKEIFR